MEAAWIFGGLAGGRTFHHGVLTKLRLWQRPDDLKALTKKISVGKKPSENYTGGRRYERSDPGQKG